MASQVQLVLLATGVGEHGTSPGLQLVGGQPVINYWLAALRQCPRLLPAVDKVTVVTSPDTHEDYVAWASSREQSAGGFPLECLLPNPEPGCEAAPLNDLICALHAVPRLRTANVLAASLDAFMGPSIPLRQLVEHAVIRGKEAVVFTRPPPGHSLAGEAEVSFVEQGSASAASECANPKVAGVEAAPSGVADGMSTAVLAPMLFLHRDTTAALAQGGGPALPPPGPHQLARFAAQLCGAEVGRPVYGFHVDLCMPVASGLGLLLAVTFMEYYQEQLSRASKRGIAAEALETVTRSAQQQGITANVDLGVEQLMARSSEVKQHFLRFSVVAGDRVAAKLEAARVAALTGAAEASPVKYGVRDELPLRFRDVSTLKHNPRKQHPVYQTTANDIGLKKPTQLDAPDVYAGSAGGFTKNFTGPFQQKSLQTATTRSKVHRLLDDF